MDKVDFSKIMQILICDEIFTIYTQDNADY